MDKGERGSGGQGRERQWWTREREAVVGKGERGSGGQRRERQWRARHCMRVGEHALCEASQVKGGTQRGSGLGAGDLRVAGTTSVA